MANNPEEKLDPEVGTYHRDNVPDDLPQPWAKFWEMFRRARDTRREIPKEDEE